MIDRIKRAILSSRPFKAYEERKLRKTEISRFLSQARKFMETYSIPSNERASLLARYEKDLRKYMFSFDEWYRQYDLSDASEDEKRSFISRSRAQKHYRSIITPQRRALFHDKRLFLSHFRPFIKHRFLEVGPTTPQHTVLQMINSSWGGGNRQARGRFFGARNL